MNYILPTNANTSSMYHALNALAVTKKAQPIYFYPLLSSKVITTALDATKKDTSLSLTSGHGLVPGDYFRLGTAYNTMTSEVLMVKEGLTTTSMTVRRAQQGSTAEVHTIGDKIYVRQDGLDATQLGTGTATEPESRIVIDLGHSSFYDLSLEVQCATLSNDSAGTLVLNYAFSGFGDLDLGATTTTLLETQLANTKETLSCAFPDGTANEALYYMTEQFKPTARYLYIWITDHASLTGVATTAKIRLNTV